jgi:hypothetical protein
MEAESLKDYLVSLKDEMVILHKEKRISEKSLRHILP